MVQMPLEGEGEKDVVGTVRAGDDEGKWNNMGWMMASKRLDTR